MANGISSRKVSHIASHQQTQCHLGGLHYPWSYLDKQQTQPNTLAWSCTISLAGRSTSTAQPAQQMPHVHLSKETCEDAQETLVLLHTRQTYHGFLVSLIDRYLFRNIRYIYAYIQTLYNNNKHKQYVSEESHSTRWSNLKCVMVRVVTSTDSDI